MVLLEPDPFLTELMKMYDRQKEKGVVAVTVKRSDLKRVRSRKREVASGPTSTDGPEFVCFVRATDGKRKISTRVSAKEVGKFHVSLTTVQRAQMDSLKRKEKKKKVSKEREGTSRV